MNTNEQSRAEAWSNGQGEKENNVPRSDSLAEKKSGKGETPAVGSEVVTRVCKKCGESKPLTEKYFRKSGRSCFRKICHKCAYVLNKPYMIEYVKRNRAAITAQARAKRNGEYVKPAPMTAEEKKLKANVYWSKYYPLHREELREKRQLFRESNRDLIRKQEKQRRDRKRALLPPKVKIVETSRVCTKCGCVKPLTDEFFPREKKKWFLHKCRCCFAADCRERYRRNPEYHVARAGKWKKDNSERSSATSRRYREEHKDTLYEKHKAYMTVFLRESPEYCMAQSLRGRIRKAIKSSGKKKSLSTELLVGCSIKDLIRHIESLFEPGMTWENYGRHGWNIDHIRPCASFDLSSDANQKLCFHFPNLRPMWETDNNKKKSWHEGRFWRYADHKIPSTQII